MDRRDFLKKGAYGLAGAIVGGSIIGGLTGLVTGCSTTAQKRIGLQLYSLREAMAGDPAGTLAAIAEMGYTELETANYRDGKVYGYSPAEFRTLVESLGMKVSSCHIGRNWNPDQEEEIYAWWTQAIADHKALGCRYIVVPSIRLGETIAEMDELCAYFNRVAAMCKAEGIVFGYHNHAAEFRPVEEQVWFDYVMTHTSPDVAFEMDVYWVKEAGVDPVALLNKYPGRFPLLHIKDDSIIGASGKIDFAPIFDAGYKQGMKDYYVEVEQYQLPSPQDCVARSFDFLVAAPYVK